MSLTRTTAAAATLLALLACDNGVLNPPAPDGGAIFARYVAFGNSITAGFQSGGISDSLQRESYAVYLASAMGTQFNLPLLNAPGCPPPIVNIFTGERTDNLVPCALRSSDLPEYINNVAVPGAKVIDLTTNLNSRGGANELTTFILGGRTQLEAASAVKPTFVSVWIGNNDVLGAAIAGDAGMASTAAEFEADYVEFMDELDQMNVENGVLIGVVDVTVVPFFSPGVAYFQASLMGALPPTFSVDASCGPASAGGLGETTLVPFGYGFGELLAAASASDSVTLNCSADMEVLSGGELAALAGLVQQYNAVIQREATERGFAYVDPNPTLNALKASGDIPLFPNASGPDAIAAPFGTVFSRDGIHPSSSTHVLIANTVIGVINDTYGTSLEMR